MTLQPQLAKTIDQAYQKSLVESQVEVDRIFAFTLVVQWLFGILCSLVVSPLAWEGAQSSTHAHVWAAILLGGLIVSLPILFVVIAPGRLFTRMLVAASQLLFSALLIHLMGGRIEAHFHIFVSLAMLKAYRDYRVFIPAVLVTLADHVMRGYFWPQSVFGELAVSSWRPFEHAAWLAFETLALCMLIRRNLGQLRSLATLQCSLAEQCVNLEVRVEERTKQLQSAKVFQERVLNSIEAGVCILDESGKIVFANEPWLEFSRTGEEHLIGTGVGENYLAACEKSDAFIGKGFPGMADAIREVQLGERKSCSLEYECHSRGKERWMHASITPVVWEGEQVIAVTHVDVTGIHQARSRAAALAKLVLDSPHEVFVFSQDEFRFIEVNLGACHNLGYSREELLGMSPADIKPDYDEQHLRDLFASLINGNVENLQFDATHRRKDGSTYDCSLSLHCSTLEGVEVLVAFVTDISEQLNLQSQLNESRKLESIGQLAAGVAHEINTPMQCVFGNVEFLGNSFSRLMSLSDRLLEAVDEKHSSAGEQQTAEQIRESHHYDFLRTQTPMALEEAANASNQVISVIRAMKIMSHPGSAEKSMADIHDMLRNAATITRGRWKLLANLEFDLDPQLGMVEVLPAELSQVFINMIVNAADSIAEKLGNEPQELGSIKITTRNEGNHIRIEFSDSGMGIPKSIQQKIFNKFFTTKEVGKGTGQGLSISCNVIAEKHGGNIEVESEEGKGTSFILTIPRSPNSQHAPIDADVSVTREAIPAF
ncbi:MAG: PAS domain S-box protein [Rubripirellula sp.]